MTWQAVTLGTSTGGKTRLQIHLDLLGVALTVLAVDETQTELRLSERRFERGPRAATGPGQVLAVQTHDERLVRTLPEGLADPGDPIGCGKAVADVHVAAQADRRLGVAPHRERGEAIADLVAKLVRRPSARGGLCTVLRTRDTCEGALGLCEMVACVHAIGHT